MALSLGASLLSWIKASCRRTRKKEALYVWYVELISLSILQPEHHAVQVCLRAPALKTRESCLFRNYFVWLGIAVASGDLRWWPPSPWRRPLHCMELDISKYKNVFLYTHTILTSRLTELSEAPALNSATIVLGLGISKRWYKCHLDSCGNLANLQANYYAILTLQDAAGAWAVKLDTI